MVDSLSYLKLIGCHIWKFENLSNHLVFPIEYYGVTNFMKSQKNMLVNVLSFELHTFEIMMFYNWNDKKNAIFYTLSSIKTSTISISQ